MEASLVDLKKLEIGRVSFAGIAHVESQNKTSFPCSHFGEDPLISLFSFDTLMSISIRSV